MHMQILDSSLAMRATHEATTTYSRTERLAFWRGQRPDFEGDRTRAAGPPATATAAVVSLSDEAVQRATACRCRHESGDVEREMDPREELKARLLAKTLEYLTGMKMKVVSPGDVVGDMERARSEAGDRASEIAQAHEGARRREGGEGEQPQQPDWGMEYDFHESRTESEKTTFATVGTVKTKDGQEIQVKVSLSMSRELAQETNVSIREGNAKKVDPLVINFDGNAAELTQDAFSFDLDADGHADQISFVRSGSGFLALDQNANGTVDDGSELFGPTSGDGFAELAQYDEDGNNWIDESDSVFDKLRIWTKDAQGNDSLFALGQKGVGAIWLGSVATPFQIKGDDQQLLGEVKSSGIYLAEDGGAGTVQQVDLTVRGEAPAPEVPTRQATVDQVA